MGTDGRIRDAIRLEFISRGLDAAIAALADRQHGVVAQFQLLEIGIDRRAIARRIQTGRLHVVHRGIYSVGGRRLSPEGRWMAAVLAGGPQAVLSHLSAGGLWRLPTDDRLFVDVVAPGPRSRRGIHFHRCTLAPPEITTRLGIPVTTPTRTLLDLASQLHPNKLEQALREGLYQRRTSLSALRRLLRNHPGHRGTRALREAIAQAEDAPGIARSELERRFQRFRRRHKLPPPELNVAMRVGDLDIEADCVWRKQRLIVELDHRSTHARRRDFESDRRRDRRLQANNWRPVRVTNDDLHDEASLAADLTALLADAVQAAA